MNPEIAAGLRSLLVSNAQIAEKVTDTTGQRRVYLHIAPGDAALPYIIIRNTYGGDQPRTPRKETDGLWVVFAVAATQPEAEELDDYIYTVLEGSRPTFTNGWVADQDITFNGSAADIDTAQGVQHWSAGGYYRVRAQKNV